MGKYTSGRTDIVANISGGYFQNLNFSYIIFANRLKLKSSVTYCISTDVGFQVISESMSSSETNPIYPRNKILHPSLIRFATTILKYTQRGP